MQAPDSPNNNTGLRPTRSDKRFHLSTVSACVTKNRDSCESDSLIVILAGCNFDTYNHSGIIPYSRIITSSDVEFSDKLTGAKQHKKRMLQSNGNVILKSHLIDVREYRRRSNRICHL
jgi:hypothetical protein